MLECEHSRALLHAAGGHPAGGGQCGGALEFPRCSAATDLRAACAGVVDDLRERWALPSAYLLVDGLLRCMASRGYFQVSDGFATSTGVIGRAVSTGTTQVVQDVAADADEALYAAKRLGGRRAVVWPTQLGRS